MSPPNWSDDEGRYWWTPPGKTWLESIEIPHPPATVQDLCTCPYCKHTRSEMPELASTPEKQRRSKLRDGLFQPMQPHKTPERKSWDRYFMDIALQVATRATCDRKHVGAVLVKDKVILATGYNGSIRGAAHCDDVGHMMEDGHCVRTIHAEANAIVQAARRGVAIEGATAYVTASPCWSCFKLLASAGCKRIVYGEFYRDDRIFAFAEELGITLDSI